MKAECISCGERFEVGAHPHLGDLVTCPVCDALLEVVQLEPLELDWPYEEDEDFDDEEDEEF
ncbi:lysine biosynthesis protein LysW [Candidatus Parcubacteria bacterium]|nr:MAG: lysine biosynthesis protein LysW [Candidatus Parcubacteria bacterium]